MTDAWIATVARKLAEALNRVARERSDDAKKQVALLHTELCAAVRDEEEGKDAEL